MERDGQTRVLIAGGGVAALEAALALRSLAADRVRVELLSPEPHFWYRPLSVAAPFELGAPDHFELDGVTRGIGVRFTLGGLVAVDAWRHIAHTSKNTEIEYDVLLIACGAVPMRAIPGAVTFRGPADIEQIERLLHDIAEGGVTSVAFAIPWGATYSLPAYELALLTAAHLEKRGVQDIEITVVTPEEEPLQVFGPPASAAIRELLAERGVTLRTGAYSKEAVDGTLRLIPESTVHADRIVALPRLQGARIDGIPQTVDGFIPVDANCHVHAVDDVYAAGDITTFPVKQGGIAAQQADAAARAIAAAAGADVAPESFRPILRGVLLTGTQPRFLRRELGGDHEVEPVAGTDALWWPPAKIVGRYLAPFLASLVGAEPPHERPEDATGGVLVERELDRETLARLDPRRAPIFESEDGDRIEGVMSRDPLVVAPEDTLGEIAEAMLEHGAGAAVVGEYGRLVGIVTGFDLLRALAARVHPSDARARQWMTAEPVTVSADDALDVARTLMRQYDVDQLPVVDGQRPIGMVDREQVGGGVLVSPGLGF